MKNRSRLLPYTLGACALFVFFVVGCKSTPVSERPDALTSASVSMQRGSVEILGDVQNPRTWSVGELKNHFAEQIRTVTSIAGPPNQSQEISLTGIPLIVLLGAAEPIMLVPHRHFGFNHIVILEAYDGYRSYYAYAELVNRARQDPDSVMFVWEENGGQIPDMDQSFRLSDGPNRGAIRGITRIIVVDGTKIADSY